MQLKTGGRGEAVFVYIVILLIYLPDEFLLNDKQDCKVI